MNPKMLTLAGALAMTTAVTSVAEAGGGVRLPFGYPMGSFVATPAHGGGGHTASTSSSKKLAKKKAAEVAARRAAATSKAEKKVEKDETKDETAESKEPATTGSTALIETSKEPAPAEDATGSKVETATAAPVEAPAVEEKDAEPKKEESSKVSELNDLACKKYIPAIGLTVSVGCEK